MNPSYNLAAIQVLTKHVLHFVGVETAKQVSTLVVNDPDVLGYQFEIGKLGNETEVLFNSIFTVNSSGDVRCKTPQSGQYKTRVLLKSLDGLTVYDSIVLVVEYSVYYRDKTFNVLKTLPITPDKDLEITPDDLSNDRVKLINGQFKYPQLSIEELIPYDIDSSVEDDDTSFAIAEDKFASILKSQTKVATNILIAEPLITVMEEIAGGTVIKVEQNSVGQLKGSIDVTTLKFICTDTETKTKLPSVGYNNQEGTFFYLPNFEESKVYEISVYSTSLRLSSPKVIYTNKGTALTVSGLVAIVPSVVYEDQQVSMAVVSVVNSRQGEFKFNLTWTSSDLSLTAGNLQLSKTTDIKIGQKLTLKPVNLNQDTTIELTFTPSVLSANKSSRIQLSPIKASVLLVVRDENDFVFSNFLPH
jgi:hypothetical protein